MFHADLPHTRSFKKWVFGKYFKGLNSFLGSPHETRCRYTSSKNNEPLELIKGNMALKKCKECKKEVSTKAKNCPHCGAKKPTENKFLSFIVGVGVVVFFCLAF